MPLNLVSSSGNSVAVQNAAPVNTSIIQYTKYPPINCRSVEREKNAVTPAGPRARNRLATVCESPFVTPRTSGLAAADVMKIKTQPLHYISEKRKRKKRRKREMRTHGPKQKSITIELISWMIKKIQTPGVIFPPLNAARECMIG